jgi:TatA/E family protein of Tat protein translocase
MPIGFQELIVLFVVALLVFGPDKLPGMARSLGKAVTAFRKASSELTSAITHDPLGSPGESDSQAIGDEPAVDSPTIAPEQADSQHQPELANRDGVGDEP